MWSTGDTKIVSCSVNSCTAQCQSSFIHSSFMVTDMSVWLDAPHLVLCTLAVYVFPLWMPIPTLQMTDTVKQNQTMLWQLCMTLDVFMPWTTDTSTYTHCSTTWTSISEYSHQHNFCTRNAHAVPNTNPHLVVNLQTYVTCYIPYINLLGRGEGLTYGLTLTCVCVSTCICVTLHVGAHLKEWCIDRTKREGRSY